MKKKPIDKKIEEKVDIDFSYEDIENKINIEKYVKENTKKKNYFPVFAPVACSLLCFAIIGISLLGGNNNNQTTENNNISDEVETSIEMESSVVSSLEQEIVSNEDNMITENDNFSEKIPGERNDSEENGTVEGDYYKKYVGPVIDLIKNESPYQFSTGPLAVFSLYEVIINNFSLYEVNYLGNIDDKYYCAYVDISTANEIYEENKDVLDAETASETNIIDGSIIKWFYSKKYNEDLISWYEFSPYENIPRIINEKMVLGVYTLENVCIYKEITTSYDISRTYDYYSSKRFVYETGKYITSSSINEIKNVWYPSLNNVDELNFDRVYFNSFSFDLNNFEDAAIINDNQIRIFGDMTPFVNPIDEDQEKWNNFVEEANSYKIENESNTYYYDNIVSLIIDYLK